MIVTSSGIVDGKFLKKYGKHGEQFNKDGIPSCSIPVSILESPERAVSYALILEDKDAIPVCGFSWIHWCAANIKRTELLENESVSAKDYVQGATSYSSKLQGLDRYQNSCYGGMTPPDAPHIYELHVFALDCELELQHGFYMNELYRKMQGHILDTATIAGIYDN